MWGDHTITAQQTAYYHAESLNCPNPLGERWLAETRGIANLPGLRAAKGGLFGGSRATAPPAKNASIGRKCRDGRRPDEADLSAESYSSETKSRVSRENALSRRTGDPEASSGQGSKATGRHNTREIGMVRRTGRFERADRLLNSRDFRRIGRAGERLATRHFVVLVGAGETLREAQRNRLGVTVSRRVGNAVVRNRIKRSVREWFRRSRGSLAAPVDLVVIARREAATLSAGGVGGVLNEMLFGERSEGR